MDDSSKDSTVRRRLAWLVRFMRVSGFILPDGEDDADRAHIKTHAQHGDRQISRLRQFKQRAWPGLVLLVTGFMWCNTIGSLVALKLKPPDRKSGVLGAQELSAIVLMLGTEMIKLGLVVYHLTHSQLYTQKWCELVQSLQDMIALFGDTDDQDGGQVENQADRKQKKKSSIDPKEQQVRLPVKFILFYIALTSILTLIAQKSAIRDGSYLKVNYYGLYLAFFQPSPHPDYLSSSQIIVENFSTLPDLHLKDLSISLTDNERQLMSLTDNHNDVEVASDADSSQSAAISSPLPVRTTPQLMLLSVADLLVRAASFRGIGLGQIVASYLFGNWIVAYFSQMRAQFEHILAGGRSSGEISLAFDTVVSLRKYYTQLQVLVRSYTTYYGPLMGLWTLFYCMYSISQINTILVKTTQAESSYRHHTEHEHGPDLSPAVNDQPLRPDWQYATDERQKQLPDQILINSLMNTSLVSTQSTDVIQQPSKIEANHGGAKAETGGKILGNIVFLTVVSFLSYWACSFASQIHTENGTLISLLDAITSQYGGGKTGNERGEFTRKFSAQHTAASSSRSQYAATYWSSSEPVQRIRRVPPLVQQRSEPTAVLLTMETNREKQRILINPNPAGELSSRMSRAAKVKLMNDPAASQHRLAIELNILRLMVSQPDVCVSLVGIQDVHRKLFLQLQAVLLQYLVIVLQIMLATAT